MFLAHSRQMSEDGVVHPDRDWLDGLFRPPAAITLLSGPSSSGKTLLCLRAVAAARAAGLSVRGVLTPGHYAADGARVGIDLLDPATGQRWPLAVRHEQDAGASSDAGASLEAAGSVATIHWRFAPDVLARGAALLVASGACDLLVIDEIGPLELQRNQGWVVALDVLRAAAYRRALVVIRPGLLEALLARLAPLPAHVIVLPGPQY